MKTKITSLALLIAAGLLSSTVTASAFITYGDTLVNGTTYDLSPYANLTGANLYNANLTGAYLYNAKLFFADLSYANLTGAYLINANLTAANLGNANLTGAYLYNANLSYVNLYNANLTNADLSYANLSYTDLTGATVSYSNWADFSTNSGASGLGSYSYNTSLINYANASVPEPSTYGLIGIGALGVAFAARRKKQKSV